MRTALKKLDHAIERMDLGGWLMLLAGALLIALAVLTPAALDVRRLKYQQQVMQEHLTTLTTENDNYIQLIGAVKSNDAPLLQRLAWNELHLKPAGSQPVDGVLPSEPGATTLYQQWVVPPEPDLTPVDRAFAASHNTQLVRLMTGPKRPMMMIAGAVLIGMGLITSLREPEKA
ncbi:MAG: hypothetical protein WC058_11180 [Phycisphaeraceae bacterium]